MSDQTPVPQADPKVAAVVQDAFDAAALGKAIIDAIKAGGIQNAAPLLPRTVALVQKDISDVTAAVPAIKAGVKTSEFWIVVGAMVLVGVFPLVTGKQLPMDSVTVIGAISAVYAVVRGLTKSSTATAAAK